MTVKEKVLEIARMVGKDMVDEKIDRVIKRMEKEIEENSRKLAKQYHEDIEKVTEEDNKFPDPRDYKFTIKVPKILDSPEGRDKAEQIATFIYELGGDFEEYQTEGGCFELEIYLQK